MFVINPGPVPTKSKVFGIQNLPNEIRARMMNPAMYRGTVQALVRIFDGSLAWINVDKRNLSK